MFSVSARFVLGFLCGGAFSAELIEILSRSGGVFLQTLTIATEIFLFLLLSLFSFDLLATYCCSIGNCVLLLSRVVVTFN